MLHSVINVPDEALWTEIQSGNEKAFDALFLRYYASLSVYAGRYVDLSDAQEIVQDIMIWLWENRHMLTFSADLKSYLFRSVKNKCYTRISQNELKQRVHEAIYQQQSSVDDPDFYIVDELARNIESALARLPEAYREAFELNRFQRKTYAEIALLLDVSPKTIDYRIQQALKQLRKELKDYLPLLSFLFTIYAE